VIKTKQKDIIRNQKRENNRGEIVPKVFTSVLKDDSYQIK